MPVTGENNLAFDATVRSMDKDGRMHIAKSHISKACVNPYYGEEIPGYQELGLDRFKIYYMFRDPIELARGASTFARLPILSRHVPISSAAHPSELVVGGLGSDVEFNDPYLDADVCIWTKGAIEGIESEEIRQFSCAYRYTPDMTPGEYHGQRYDGVMREIHGNHLALVASGRAGNDVLAADEDIMAKTTKLGKALVITLGNLSPKIAQDSLLALVGQASKKTLNAEKISAELIALDAELDPKRIASTLDVVVALDAEKEEKEKPAEDEDDEDDDPAQDDEKDEKKDDKKAMDAAMVSVRAEMRAENQARQDVRDIVGDIVTQDSAENIYAFALDALKVNHEGVTGVPAMKALFTLAKNQHTTKTVAPVAMDAAGVLSQFPGIAHIRILG